MSRARRWTSCFIIFFIWTARKNSPFYQLEKENISKAPQPSKVSVYTKSILKHVIEGLGEWGDTFHSSTRVRKKFEILDDNPFDNATLRYVMTGSFQGGLKASHNELLPKVVSNNSQTPDSKLESIE